MSGFAAVLVVVLLVAGMLAMGTSLSLADLGARLRSPSRPGARPTGRC